MKIQAGLQTLLSWGYLLSIPGVLVFTEMSFPLAPGPQTLIPKSKVLSVLAATIPA